jgi:hypothetical protein
MPKAILGQCPLDPEHGSLAGSLGTPHVSYIISINKDKVPPIRVYVSSISQTILRQTHQTQNALRTKTSGKRPRSGNSRVLHTKHIYNKSITTLVDLNHLPQGDSSNGAHGKTRHPLEAI